MFYYVVGFAKNIFISEMLGFWTSYTIPFCNQIGNTRNNGVRSLPGAGAGAGGCAAAAGAGVGAGAGAGALAGAAGARAGAGDPLLGILDLFWASCF